tara:strand:- start:1866 stop:3356 length:1491 start_codon:yes stop_codon:yes gene_type:complete
MSINEQVERYKSVPHVPQHTQYMNSHIKGSSDHLRNDSFELRQCSPEQVKYHEYIQSGSPHGPVLYAVKGEHWNGVCPAFLEFINQFQLKREDMGYAECGYGIQKHRDFLKKLIKHEHFLSNKDINSDLDIEVGCLATTTRMAMYDLAKVAKKEVNKHSPGKIPVALLPNPSWDYRGIFKDLGFEIVYMPIVSAQGWQPNISQWAEIIRELQDDNRKKISIVVSNPQHNPTGMQWDNTVTEYLLSICAEELAYLLIDDAYYNVHDSRVPLVNGIKTVLRQFNHNNGNNAIVRSGMFNRWVATRPFGKQFSSNTMGVAAITTSPQLLRALNMESWINRYHCNTHNAEIMCSWLSTKESQEWTLETGMDYTNKKSLIKEHLIRSMDWPEAKICVGPSTSYMLFEIPTVYQQKSGGIDKFTNDLFYATGTMICASLFNRGGEPYVRIHIGSHFDVLNEMIRRWYVAGLNYNQPKMFQGKDSLKIPINKMNHRTEKTCLK